MTTTTMQALLQLGGDDRIVLLPDTGTNRYGCTATPDPDMPAFGSCTASSISCAAYDAVHALAQRFDRACRKSSDAIVYARELERTRARLTALNGLDAVPGTEIVFAASGTDVHLLVAQLVAGTPALPTRVIFMGADEIGSGVPRALAGLHFNGSTACGAWVEAGVPIAAHVGLDVISVAVRERDGTTRDGAAVDAEIEALVMQCVQRRQPVLLVPVDGTKTGLIVPSVECVLRLAERYRQYLTVLIDACQFRISAATLRAYLSRDFMVTVTGSKFLGGPAFSAGLFIPKNLAQRLRRHLLPPALSAYSSRGDWPVNWAGAASLVAWANPGLLMRWEAALEELRAFRTVPPVVARAFCADFANAMLARLRRDPNFSVLPTPEIIRRGLVDPGSDPSWDTVQTIFTFLLHDTGGIGTPVLDKTRTRAVYAGLQARCTSDARHTPRFQLGQPVDCGERNGVAVSALRLCVSAPMLVQASSCRDGSAKVIGQAMQALDRTAELAFQVCRGIV